MLSERSEYFKEKFSEKCEQNVFYFEEITYLVLIDLINFIYTGEMPVIYKKKAEVIIFFYTFQYVITLLFILFILFFKKMF